MKSVRLRVKLTILATPLYRSQNYRFPYYKEFYGYMQTFFQNIYVGENAIHYTESFVYDYWNHHGLLALQIAIFLQNAKRGEWASHRLIAAQVFPEYTDLIAELTQTLTQTLDMDAGFVFALPQGITLSDGSTSYINTFNSPINLLRFKFEIGTVFKVVLQSWTLPVTEEGSSLGNPEVADPYDTTNPNGNTPNPSGGRDPLGQPYGQSPPSSSPLDPNLDPDDFSNAPDPTPSGGTTLLQGWSIPAIAGVQGSGYPVGCPAATIGESLGDGLSYQNVQNLGTAPVRIDAQGMVSNEDIAIAFPNFIAGNHFFGADGRCGVTGTRNFDS